MSELIVRTESETLLSEDVKQSLINFEKQAKAIKEQEDILKKSILKAMQENGVKQFKSDELTITYVEPSEREYFDAKAFREDNPNLYDGYVSFKKISPSIRITVK